MQHSTDSGLNLDLRCDITLSLTEKADSEATVEAWTVSKSREEWWPEEIILPYLSTKPKYQKI